MVFRLPGQFASPSRLPGMVGNDSCLLNRSSCYWPSGRLFGASAQKRQQCNYQHIRDRNCCHTANICRPLSVCRSGFACRLPTYLLKNIQAVSASKTTVTIQRDESLIPVFLAMTRILIWTVLTALDFCAEKILRSKSGS